MSRGFDNPVFKKCFRGYNPLEVEEYIASLKDDIDALKKEESDLYKKLQEANSEVEKQKRANAVGGDIIDDARKEAEKIIHDAKSRAAHIIIRTSRQCNHIVADMTSQVEEQKNIYDAARQEVLRFRHDLFVRYEDHVKKINAYAEAAGAFEHDAIGGEDLNSFMRLIDDEVDSAEDYEMLSDISPEVEERVMRIKKDAYSGDKKVSALTSDADRASGNNGIGSDDFSEFLNKKSKDSSEESGQDNSQIKVTDEPLKDPFVMEETVNYYESDEEIDLEEEEDTEEKADDVIPEKSSGISEEKNSSSGNTFTGMFRPVEEKTDNEDITVRDTILESDIPESDIVKESPEESADVAETVKSAETEFSGLLEENDPSEFYSKGDEEYDANASTGKLTGISTSFGADVPKEPGIKKRGFLFRRKPDITGEFKAIKSKDDE